MGVLKGDVCPADATSPVSPPPAVLPAFAKQSKGVLDLHPKPTTTIMKKPSAGLSPHTRTAHLLYDPLATAIQGRAGPACTLPGKGQRGRDVANPLRLGAPEVRAAGQGAGGSAEGSGRGRGGQGRS